MSLTKIGSIGINTGIQFAGVTTVAEFRVGTGSSVGIGTTAPDTALHIQTNDTQKYITLSGRSNKRNNYFGLKDSDNLEIAADEDDEGSASSIRFRIDGSEIARLHHAGRLGIGTDAPLAELHLSADNPNIEFNDVNTLSNAEITLDNTQFRIECDEDNAVDSSGIKFRIDGSDQVTINSSGDLTIKDKIVHAGETNTAIRFPENDHISFETDSDQRLRIRPGGVVLVGLATASRNVSARDAHLQLQGTSGNGSAMSITRNSANSSGPHLDFGKTRVGSLTDNTVVQSGDDLGSITFSGADGTDTVTNAAEIKAEVDGTPGSNDMPGRLVFKTTSDGSASSSERLRITKNGRLLIGDNTPRNFDGGNTPLVQVADNTSGRWGRMSSTFYGDSAIGGGIILAHSRNGTVGSHTIVQDDDKLGSIFFEGSDGSDFQRGAAIECYVDGTPGSDDMPGRMEFRTVAENTTALVTNLVIDESGRLIAASGRSTPRTNYKDTNGDSSTPSFQFETSNDDQAHSLSLTYGRNNSNGPELKLAKHRTATIGGNTIVQDSDELGCLSFLGSDGTNFIPAAAIRGVVNQTPGTNDMPGALLFSTTADGASTTTDHIRLNRNGIFDFINSGTGINFAAGHSVTPNDATVVNNTFDDFEEGTLDWEIHKADYLTTGSNSSGSQVTYQKIGSMVYVQGWIRTDGTSPANVSGKAAILTDASGNRAQLPFTPSGPGAFMVSQSRSFNNLTTGTLMVAWDQDNDDVYVHLNQSNNYKGSQGDNATLTNQTNVVICFSGHYHTND